MKPQLQGETDPVHLKFQPKSSSHGAFWIKLAAKQATCVRQYELEESNRSPTAETVIFFGFASALQDVDSTLALQWLAVG
jgi:hypothetical protein